MSDIDRIRARLLSAACGEPDVVRADELRRNLLPDGGWQDIDYDGQLTTAWQPAEHLRRLRLLTQAWFAAASPMRGDRELEQQVGRALDFWLHKDPRRPWWWEAIGAPQLLAPILLMLDVRLSGFQRSKGCEILARAKLADGVASPPQGHTGQNLVWQAGVTVHRAVLQRDARLLRHAFALIAGEIRIVGDEGIQADLSFHQHGHCLYNHGYGAGFAVDNAWFAAVAAGTACACPAPQLELLVRYILDGSQWLAHGIQPDFGALGRQIVRPAQTVAYLATAAQDLLRLPSGREEELRLLVERAAGRPAPALLGNRHFFRSDIMVHHRPGWYFSARMYSTRTWNTDALSGCEEGLLSHYLAEGATCILRHGREYRDLFPVWDWQRVPGTTVELVPQEPGDPRRTGETDFVGGVSDGVAGVATFQLMRQALRARKAWFMFADVVVCLGTHILCDSQYPVATTLNQCRLLGSVTMGGDAPEELAHDACSRLVRWVHHDGVGYIFPNDQVVHLVAASRTGAWQRISAQSQATSPVSDDVFLLSLDHGVRPGGASYAYGVFPGQSALATAAAACRLPFTVLANDARVQAVAQAGNEALGIVFHVAGEFTGGGWQIAVDRACALLLRRSTAAWQLAVADPAAGFGVLTITVRHGTGRPQRLVLELPDGAQAGASVLVPVEG